jgi:hypothetical protein
VSPLARPSKVDGLKRGLGTAKPDPSNSDHGTNLLAAPETVKPAEKWPARISMTASREMKRELEAARIDDGIEVTARLRAMITLWSEDPQLRARVDALARDLR